MFISQIFSNSKFVHISNLFKFEICSYLKFVQICLKFFKFQKRKENRKKNRKGKNKEEIPSGPAQQERPASGAN
jgi:hypothetical protein